MRLRGADWNDALDMASKRGESVAFTAAYAGSIKMLADMVRASGRGKIEVFEELASLLDSADAPVSELPGILADYEKKVASRVSGERVEIDAEDLISRLEKMSESIKSHIRSGEIVSDGEGNSWFNGYYDNDAERVEGVFDGGVRMMLTSQVFTVMFGTATEDMVRDVIKAADKYLYAPALGGYKLNTDFHEVKMNMGRAFGFAYGEKENGAVFCHMAVMYAYALYSRGFAREGFKVFDALYRQSVAEGPDGGRMYPGIPEYFNGKGRGMYPYLTGAASWAVMLVLKQMFGVSGRGGRLVLAPALLAGQFGDDGRAEVSLYHDGRPLKVTYVNPGRKDFGEYKISRVTVGGAEYSCGGAEFEVPAESLSGADSIVVELE
jgi:cellobiose phosphorylase